ncbi:hypothetical protein [Lacticaseibacillus manihotivorans]|uniref:hypothetical protein n=1 Tax=Lacticaseibacillus manihotivorans TaxID=88233 RepID=UPI000AEB0BAD|nr:hypothetical protein [Lacticaseibacillus manihotivorans]
MGIDQRVSANFAELSKKIEPLKFKARSSSFSGFNLLERIIWNPDQGEALSGMADMHPQAI